MMFKQIQDSTYYISEQVRNIRKDKRIYSEIAKDYRIMESTVSAIKNYKLWSEVK